jgi:hypothetical protein
VNRLMALYGDTEEDWVKKSSLEIKLASQFDKRYSKEVHWYESIRTGEKVELKLKQQLKK